MKSWGFAPNPTYFFVLTQKSMQKKSRLRPPRTKKLRLAAKKSELAPRSAQRFEQQIFSTPPALVFRLAGRCRSLKPFLMLGESARRRTSSVRSRTSSVVSKAIFYPLTFILVFGPSWGKVFSAVLVKAGIVERCRH